MFFLIPEKGGRTIWKEFILGFFFSSFTLGNCTEAIKMFIFFLFLLWNWNKGIKYKLLNTKQAAQFIQCISNGFLYNTILKQQVNLKTIKCGWVISWGCENDSADLSWFSIGPQEIVHQTKSGVTSNCSDHNFLRTSLPWLFFFSYTLNPICQ